MSANWWACTCVSVKYRALGNRSEQRNHEPTTTETHTLCGPGGTGVRRPPIPPRDLAAGMCSLWRGLSVYRVYSKEPRYSFVPGCFISLLSWSSRAVSAEGYLLLTVCQGAVRRILVVLVPLSWGACSGDGYGERTLSCKEPAVGAGPEVTLTFRCGLSNTPVFD